MQNAKPLSLTCRPPTHMHLWLQAVTEVTLLSNKHEVWRLSGSLRMGNCLQLRTQPSICLGSQPAQHPAAWPHGLNPQLQGQRRGSVAAEWDVVGAGVLSALCSCGFPQSQLWPYKAMLSPGWT